MILAMTILARVYSACPDIIEEPIAYQRLDHRGISSDAGKKAEN